MPSDAPALMWFRQDLRLRDNPALAAAARSGRPLVCLYVLDDAAAGDWRPGGASRWWLHHSLVSLTADLAKRRQTLVLRRGRADAAVRATAAEVGAAEVFWNRVHEPFAVARDTRLAAALQADGIDVRTFNGALLFDPGEITTAAGAPYKVFTPFWRACRAAGLPTDAGGDPGVLRMAGAVPASDALADWSLLPTQPDWAAGLRAEWSVGEDAAVARLDGFLDDALKGYGDGRDRPGVRGTSRLSPHLHFGEISPKRVVARTLDAAQAIGADADADKFLSEIGWREFSHTLLHATGDLHEANHQSKFDAFPWRDADDAFAAWSRGATGYPIVDAGMRELWATGWMHNRVRMIVGSFLVKHLLIDWRRGARWFWDTLVDADLANNSAGWQWIAGTGADAAPYFRIFNPMTQGARFDPDGAYVRRWIPEIAGLPDARLHAPWRASEAERAAAGVVLGETYPEPIVDHAAARERALAAFKSLKGAD